MLKHFICLSSLTLILFGSSVFCMELESADQVITRRRNTVDLTNLLEIGNQQLCDWNKIRELIRSEKFQEAIALVELFCKELVEKLELNSGTNEGGYILENLENFLEEFETRAELIRQELDNLDKSTFIRGTKQLSTYSCMILIVLVLMICSAYKPELLFFPLEVAIGCYSIPLATYLISITAICLLMLDKNPYAILFIANFFNWFFLGLKAVLNKCLIEANKAEAVSKIKKTLQEFEDELKRKIGKFKRKTAIIIEL